MGLGEPKEGFGRRVDDKDLYTKQVGETKGRQRERTKYSRLI